MHICVWSRRYPACLLCMWVLYFWALAVLWAHVYICMQGSTGKPNPLTQAHLLQEDSAWVSPHWKLPSSCSIGNLGNLRIARWSNTNPGNMGCQKQFRDQCAANTWGSEWTQGRFSFMVPPGTPACTYLQTHYRLSYPGMQYVFCFIHVPVCTNLHAHSL